MRTLIRRLRSDERGFTILAAMGTLVVVTLLGVAAFAAANSDIPLARYDQDDKQAYSAAEAGINDYLFHLNQDTQYWTYCDSVPGPTAVSDRYVPGQGQDTRRTRYVPNTNSYYSIELLTVLKPNGNGGYWNKCNESQPDQTMIDPGTGTFKTRVTGVSRNAKRSVVATFRRKGFLDYLATDDIETTDPAWYVRRTNGRPNAQCLAGQFATCTGPDLVTWASTNCAKWWRQGRGNSVFFGHYTDQSGGNIGPLRCDVLFWYSGDKLNGPIHTNDQLVICGNPTFGRDPNDMIENSDTDWRGYCGGDNPTFLGTFVPNSPVLSLPPSNASLKQIVDPAYLFTGTTYIRMSGNNMNVTDSSGNTQTLPMPPDGVVYVQNGACGTGYNAIQAYDDPPGCADVYVQGSYSESVTIASEKDIIVDGSINKASDNLLGLIANGFVRIYHPVNRPDPNNPTNCTNAQGTLQNVSIDAAILSLNHSFSVDNAYCGAPMGSLSVFGAIAEKFAGLTGVAGGSGIIHGYSSEQHTYDDRLRYRSPPHFLDPVQSSWHIIRYTEQVPATPKPPLPPGG